MSSFWPMQNLLRSRFLSGGQRHTTRGLHGSKEKKGNGHSLLPESASPDGEVHHVVDLVPPDEAPEGEALELDDQDVGQPPQEQLLGGLTVLLALGTVPVEQSSLVSGGAGGSRSSKIKVK